MTDAPAPPCLAITSVCQGKPYVLGIQKKIGLQIKNKELSGFLLQSLFLGDVTTSQAKKSNVRSFFQFLIELPRSPNYVVCCSALKAPCSFPSRNLITICWAFPGHPVVKYLPSNAGDAGLIPSQATKISHAWEQISRCTTARESPWLCD